MNSKGLFGLIGLLWSGGAVAQTGPACTQDHPGPQHRAESLAKNGDSRMGWSAAAHTVKYAVQRYGLNQFVSAAEVTKAQDEMYEFLKWKLGGPSPLAVTWVDAGYQHFDRAYVDEAAALLLGLITNGSNPLLTMPDWFTRQMPLLMANFWGLGPEEVVYQWFTFCGIIPDDAFKGDPFFGRMMDVVIYIREKKFDLVKSVFTSFPKKYDVDNRLVEMAITAKKAPTPAGFPTGNTQPTTSPPPGATAGVRPTGTAGGPPGAGGLPPARSDLDARVAELERRVAELERIVAQLQGGRAAPGAPSGAGALQPSDAGFVSARLTTNARDNRVKVKINGMPIAVYDEIVPPVVLDGMLKPGFMNTLEFEWDQVGKYSYVMIEVQSVTDKTFNRIYRFEPKENRLKDSFTLAFVGEKK